MKINPVPLSVKTLDNAVRIIPKIFLYAEDQKLAKRDLSESLSMKNLGCTKNYWVILNDDVKVIAITGLYFESRTRIEKATAWLGWFGVHPNFRKTGIGTSLLRFTIKEAKKARCKRIRLYTSLDKNEEDARRLYEKEGFRQIHIGRDTESIYYEKAITKEVIMQKEQSSIINEIKIDWEGPLSVNQVIADMTDEGEPPYYEGHDYGVYQIYGKHILSGSDTLLYIGRATRQSFSSRFVEHNKDWLGNEEEIKIYLGRIDDPNKYSRDDHWKTWERDAELAENIMIYKYSPNYNNVGITDQPSLAGFEKVSIMHQGEKHKLNGKDTAPDDYN
jgi:GNAT superfamily N-acetyltransferase